MSTTLQDTINKEIVIGAPRERVYAAITDPKQLAQWFPDAVEGDIRPGERPIFDFGEYGRHSAYVVATDPHSYVAYRWIPGSIHVPQGFIGDVLAEPNTLCEFFLDETPEGTRVRLVESGFASLPEEFYAKSIEDNTGGWDVMIYRLKTYAETGTAVSPAQRMSELASVFRALGDPVRLEMVKRLSAGAPFTIAAIADGFSISRQGVRKHLQVLADANLVQMKPTGRDVIVQLSPENLENAKAFIAQLERDWDHRLAALKRFVEET